MACRQKSMMSEGVDEKDSQEEENTSEILSIELPPEYFAFVMPTHTEFMVGEEREFHRM